MPPINPYMPEQEKQKHTLNHKHIFACLEWKLGKGVGPLCVKWGLIWSCWGSHLQEWSIFYENTATQYDCNESNATTPASSLPFPPFPSPKTQRKKYNLKNKKLKKKTIFIDIFPLKSRTRFTNAPRLLFSPRIHTYTYTYREI